MADNRARVISTGVNSADSGTEWLQIRSGYRTFFSISIEADGSWSGTITLQRKRPEEADAAAKDVESFTGSSQDIAETHGHWDYRLFVKSGDYTAGTVDLELHK